MNQEEIIRMARDCGINFHQAGWPELERFFYSAQEAEREACATLADKLIADECFDVGTEIRARGQQ